ncbi:MAG: hypothetical protein IT210_08865 [Armatimonadetes bacterium]|nr:hypothetical protein [Armatimonadota bacterium]
MIPKVSFLHDAVILDACCIINLCASGQVDAILRAIPVPVMVAAYVAAEEIHRYDLNSLVEQGLLRVVEPETEDEANDVLNFAAALGGDGEAYTGAIAVYRHWAIATDERRVLNFYERISPQLQRLTTPELLKFWADTTGPEKGIIRQALQQVAIEGSYTISQRHNCYAWWLSFCPDTMEPEDCI